MDLVKFYKGLEENYSEDIHSNSIYQCTDTGNTYIFGVLNKNYKESGGGGGTDEKLPPTQPSGNYRVLSAENDFSITEDNLGTIENNYNIWSPNSTLFNTVSGYITGGYTLYMSISISGITYYLPIEASSGTGRIYLKIDVDYDNITRPDNTYVQLQIELWFSSMSNKTALVFTWIVGEPDSGGGGNTGGGGDIDLSEYLKYKVVSSLPSNPDSGTLYLIEEKN